VEFSSGFCSRVYEIRLSKRRLAKSGITVKNPIDQEKTILTLRPFSPVAIGTGLFVGSGASISILIGSVTVA
jgi:uncharacterized oligopeptide transporter (OPT) family protein